jgi:hypothetical protein
MTYPDRRLEGPLEPAETVSENRQDVVPASERSQDPVRSSHDLVSDSSRPLTDAERKAADQDPGVAERVYAPASERVPKTVEGYRDVTEHPDLSTPERQTVGQASTTPAMTSDAEPSFTRVPRPNNGNGNDSYGYETDWSAQPNRWMSNLSGGSAVPFGVGWLTLTICGGIGVWLWMRWQRERNKPINRLRRQALQARERAYALRDQMPDVPEEAVRPAMGVGTALLSLAIVLWQQSQSRSRSRTDEARSRANKASQKAGKAGRQASRKATDMGQQVAQTLGDLDWFERLTLLRELWRERAPLAR